jgi:apolipoprotein N-acyltransferase
LKPVFAHLGGATGNYTGQQSRGILFAKRDRRHAVICYESIWGEWVAKSVKQGAQFIAIITNDGWWENTSGKDQHMDYAKLRAIETAAGFAGRPIPGSRLLLINGAMLYSNLNGGYAPRLKQDINLNSDITFYVEHGDYLPKAGAF